MRPDVLDLKAFYASPLGPPTVHALRACLPRFKPGERILALGYGLPVLAEHAQDCERVVAAMPARQGAIAWPQTGAGDNAVCLVDIEDLPFVDALFDHVIFLHCLEFSGRVGTSLLEATRVLAPAGQVHIIVPNRVGPWCRAESTPFGNGRPFSSGQLERLMEEAHLAAERWRMALMLPPVPALARWMRRWEGIGNRFWSKFGGLYVVTAKKAVFKRRPSAPATTHFAPIRVPAFQPTAACTHAQKQRLPVA
ncbi:MAG: methyltransferase domain-containing protein [Pseudomonadota bacterium]